MLKGKTALITGSASGIGLGLARAFATEDETMDELLANLHEAIEGCPSVDVEQAPAC